MLKKLTNILCKERVLQGNQMIGRGVMSYRSLNPSTPKSLNIVFRWRNIFKINKDNQKMSSRLGNV